MGDARDDNDVAQSTPAISAHEATDPHLKGLGDDKEQSEQVIGQNNETQQTVSEEEPDSYCPGGFHPVYIGDVFNGRYEVLNKIGYGVYSTVWIVEDLQHRSSERRAFFALKILRADCYDGQYDIFEREILRQLKEGGREFLGYKHVVHLIDDFEHSGPNGKHVCLVFELYGETLRSFGVWFPEQMIPNGVMQRFTTQLLLALDYVHDMKIIHTDIQPSNIFVKVRDYSMIESDYLKRAPVPRQDRNETRYTVIPSCPLRGAYFNNSDNFLNFDIALGDWGVACWSDKHLSERIQPVLLRAPEVLIRAPWDIYIDYWNVGALLPELFRSVRTFDGRVPPDGHYELREHIAEMVHYFGPFPRALLEKGDPEIVRDIFDDNGKVKGWSCSEEPLNLDVFAPGLDEETKEEFISFLRAIMQIEPEKRPSAEDLLRHPFLGALPPKEEMT
ncbi:kinase-like domain-containing protein [Xylariaceae sp. FL1272]|nr:kinase-like domain-containing protein [Xylariaceae sp. FL1272]